MGSFALGEARPLTGRAFFGLPLPEQHRTELAAYIALCAQAAPAFRWVAPSNLHLTVRFIGSIELAKAEQIADTVAGAPPAAFELQLGEAGSFGRGRRARVLWLGLLSGRTELERLAQKVEAECVRAGLEAEERPLHPHLTLARSADRAGTPLPELPEAPRLAAWRARDLVLYRSHLGRGGPVYEALRAITLA